MGQPQYLDDNGNPVGAPSGKVYLDDTGNPVAPKKSVVPQQVLDQIRVRNASPTQFEFDRNPQNQIGFGGAVADWVRGLKNAPKEIAKSALMMQPPVEKLTPQQIQSARGNAFKFQPSAGPAAQELAGVNVPAMERAADVGDKGAVLGNAFAPAAAVVAGSVGADAFSSKPNPGVASDNLVAAINPTAGKAGKVGRAINNSTSGVLSDIANEANPRSLSTLGDALKQKALDIQNEYGIRMQQNAGTPVQTSSIANDILSAKTPVLEQRFPEIAKKIDDLAGKYAGKTMTVQELDELRTKLNDTLDTQLQKDGIAKAQARRDPAYAHLFKELDSVKDALYNNLPQQGNGQYGALSARDLKMQQSNIQTLQQALENRVGKLKVEQAKVNSEPGYVKVGNVTSDLLSLHPGNGFKTLAGYMRNRAATPNAQTAAAMDALRASHAPSPAIAALLAAQTASEGQKK